MTVRDVPRIEEGALVVVCCSGPKEKLWGVVLRLDHVGVALRGLDLDSVEDWLRQEISEGEALIGPSTVFLPTHRVERIYLDESSGAAAGIGDRYRTATGMDVVARLLGGREEVS